LDLNNLARAAAECAALNVTRAQFGSGVLRSNTTNRNATARLAAGIFFPQRPGLRLTTHSFSPSVVRKILRASAREPSFQEAADCLSDLADISISSRQVTRIAQEVGRQLETNRDHQVEQFRTHQLQATVETRPALAIVQVDGGRLQVRSEGNGPGAHCSSWHEDKLSLLATAAITAFDGDPEPELPKSFRDQRYVEELVRGIGGLGPMGEFDPPAESESAQSESPSDTQPTTTDQRSESQKWPELLVRTYVATTCDSEAFGPMVAAEATRRNFTNAAEKAFLGDGAAWIWTLQQRYFPDFEPIVDLMHVLVHVFSAARAAATDARERWRLFQAWAEACWQGQVDRPIEQIIALRDGLGAMSEAELEQLPEDDPRKILGREAGFLVRNRSRMDYPRYRQQGLPITSSYVESTVKLFNRRVKGSEKFWGADGAEAILQLRAAFLSEDDGLERHLTTRPCSPFRTYKARESAKAA
jgi:hypothetical protein